MNALVFLLPYLFSVFCGLTYGLFWKRSFNESLAPSFFVVMLSMVIFAMLTGSVTIGILFSVVLGVGCFLYSCKRDKFNIRTIASFFKDPGFYLFTAVYVLIFIINIGKYYADWDEFSHWGFFVKEILRLDALYCTSPLSFAHKDYVPAISLFEALWCRLSLGYSEAACFRGIQILQLSMLFSLIETASPSNHSLEEKYKKTIFAKKINWVKDNYKAILRWCIILLLPLYFNAQDFYHTINQDLIYGILVFYCVYLVIIDDLKKDSYFRLLIAITVLVLSKMTAIAYLPMIGIFYAVWYFVINKTEFKKTKVFQLLLFFTIPLIIWCWFNSYVDIYYPKSVGQSYGGVQISALADIITHNGRISYQSAVDAAFLDEIIHYPLFTKLPYIPCIALIVILLCLLSRIIKEKETKKKINITNLWIILSSVTYSAMMYCLYLTIFSEFEAVQVASIERYMTTHLCACVFILLALCFLYLPSVYRKTEIIIASVIFQNFICFLGVRQLLPGFIKHEKPLFVEETELILNNVDENDSVFIINRGDNGELCNALEYYCLPIRFAWASPGIPVTDWDINSKDISVKEFEMELCDFQYLYVHQADEYFSKKYLEAFTNTPEIIDNSLYKIIKNNDGISLGKVNRKS